MQYKNIHRIEKFKKILEPRVEKHTFSRTIQDQIKFKNIQEHLRISRTSGHVLGSLDGIMLRIIVLFINQDMHAIRSCT